MDTSITETQPKACISIKKKDTSFENIVSSNESAIDHHNQYQIGALGIF